MSKGFRFCALFLLFSQALLASPTGSITGFVKDPTGAFVPGVKITLTNLATNAQLSTISNETGRFEFPQLAPTTYSNVFIGCGECRFQKVRPQCSGSGRSDHARGCRPPGRRHRTG